MQEWIGGHFTDAYDFDMSYTKRVEAEKQSDYKKAVEVMKKDIKVLIQIVEPNLKDKYTRMAFKNDIAYKYGQIEAIMKKYPEYFI